MNDKAIKPSWALPFTSPAPNGKARAARIAVIAAMAVWLIAVTVQFQHSTMHKLKKAAAPQAVAEAKIEKIHKGAIGRWRKAVVAFWNGQDIYSMPPAPATSAQSFPAIEQAKARNINLHPNMPFVVILMTPFAYMPVWAMALSWNLLKLAAIVASVLMAVRVANQGQRRMPDWVAALGIAWCWLFIVGDIQHGNTNIFVLFFIVLHLWLYRRGQDWLAGASLAMAICLKMTPALFVLYWLYQRNWKLLASTALFGLLMAVGIPSLAMGPDRMIALSRSWLNNLIVPGLVKNAWYPIHVNQSIPGVFSRLFLEGKNGDMFWNPDDQPYYKLFTEEHGWITLIALPPATVKTLVRIAQLVVVSLAAWAIGWRKLPRDDGRRALHYGLVTLGMLMLNQRTWDHHAGILLVGCIAIWQAVAFGVMKRAARAWALGLVLSAGALEWLSGQGVFQAAALLAKRGAETGNMWADHFDAYGPVLLVFTLMFAAGVVLLAAMRRSETPYAEQRQKL